MGKPSAVVLRRARAATRAEQEEPQAHPAAVQIGFFGGRDLESAAVGQPHPALALAQSGHRGDRRGDDDATDLAGAAVHDRHQSTACPAATAAACQSGQPDPSQESYKSKAK